VAALGRWQQVARAPARTPQICDLASTRWGLLAAASRNALSEDGAAILRVHSDGALTSLLEWDGQGFLRVHELGGRLVVPDADAPFHPLAFAFDWDVDGYVFVSNAAGELRVDRRALLPNVYHVFDVAPLRDGRLLASTGAYPPEAVAYFSDRAPAALFASAAPGDAWQRVLDFPTSNAVGVHRFVYLLALADQDVLLASTETPATPAVRITGLSGGSPQIELVQGLFGFVLRWAQAPGRVYAVVQTGSHSELFVSRDEGRTFTGEHAPSNPQSLLWSDAGLLLLADGALWLADDATGFHQRVRPAGGLEHVPSSLVSAPLVVHEGVVWTASPQTGAIFRAEPLR
jgi:hypothetical protein